MLSRMTLASSRLVFKPHLYMLSRMTLASSRLVFKPHLYMLSRMTLASSRLVFKPHLYMISRMTLASSTFYPSLRGGGGGGGPADTFILALWPEPGWAFCSPIWAFPSMPTLFTLCAGGRATWLRTGGLCHRHTGLRRVEKPGGCMLPPSRRSQGPCGRLAFSSTFPPQPLLGP